MENGRHAMANSLGSSKTFLFVVVGVSLSALNLRGEHLHNYQEARSHSEAPGIRAAVLLLFPCFKDLISLTGDLSINRPIPSPSILLLFLNQATLGANLTLKNARWLSVQDV